MWQWMNKHMKQRRQTTAMQSWSTHGESGKYDKYNPAHIVNNAVIRQKFDKRLSQNLRRIHYVY